MNDAVIQEGEPGDDIDEELPEPPGVPAGRTQVALTMTLAAALWGMLIYQCSSDWRITPEYAYGWSVPFLTAFLFWKRWITRPEPEPESNVTLASAAALTLLMCYLPTRLMGEANSDWRFATWGLGVQAVALTIFALYFAGGRPWLKHFWFCLAFFLVAIPWPRGAETALTKTLMPLIAQFTVEGLVWVNIPSVRQGNLIEITNGLVGIDEACSGIRSIQATLMASLFLGELYRFRYSRRFFLVVAGAAMALLFNSVRAFFLSYVAAQEGMQALDRYHDPAGFTILYICFGALWCIAYIFRGRVEIARRPETENVPRAVPTPVLLGIGIWLILAEVGTQGWFVIHEKQLVKTARWEVDWAAQPNARELPINDGVRQALGYDEGHGIQWVEGDGSKWVMFFLRWNEGNPMIKGVKYHKPDICMPAAGRVLVSDLGVEYVMAKDHKIPTRWFLFNEYGRPVYAFYSLTEDYTWPNAQPFSMENNSRWSLVRRALEGKRGQFGQQVVQVFTSGVDSNDRARDGFKKIMDKMVR
jgi:exosortase